MFLKLPKKVLSVFVGLTFNLIFVFKILELDQEAGRQILVESSPLSLIGGLRARALSAGELPASESWLSALQGPTGAKVSSAFQGLGALTCNMGC